MYTKSLKILLFFLLPITTFATTQWSNWNEIKLGNFNAYSNVVAKDPTHAYVVLSRVLLSTDSNRSAQAYLYSVDITNGKMDRLSVESLPISDYNVTMSLVVDNTGVPYVAYMSYDGNMHQISVARLKVDGSWEFIGNNIHVWNKDSEKDNRIKILCDRATNDIYLFFTQPSNQGKNLGILRKQEDNSGVSWQQYGGDNPVTSMENYTAKTLDAGGIAVAYTSSINRDQYTYNIYVATYTNLKKIWNKLPEGAGSDLGKVYLDIGYSGLVTLSYANSLQKYSLSRTDKWIVPVNGQWEDLLNGNYAQHDLMSPQWFAARDGSYINSYIALGGNDNKYHYYSQTYDPDSAKWSNPIATTTAIGSQFNVDIADTTDYDKTGANNNLFVIVDTDWSGNGRNLVLAERHALAQ